MKKFEESDKFNYPLAPQSRVVDVGCYEANWAYEMWRKYGCSVVALEPIPEFYWQCVRKLRPVGCIVMPFALGGRCGIQTLHVHGCMSGTYAEGKSVDAVTIDCRTLFDGLGWRTCDLLKLNCESAEYEILESLIESRGIETINHILVQPHTCVPGAEARWAAIQDGLSKTHECIFAENFVWEGWRLK